MPAYALNGIPAPDHGLGNFRETLRRTLILDSPYGFVDATDARWWPGGADSSSASGSVVLTLERGADKADTVALMPSAEQIALVVHTLGFSKRQLGEIFGVSRQAIYDWLKGESISPENSRKLLTLARLLLKVTTDTRRPLYHRFTTEPIMEGEPSILELLRREPWDTERLLRLLSRARDLTSRRAARETPAPVGSSQASEETNLFHNLLSLGEE